MIDPKKFGVSFSSKQCWNFGIDPKHVLAWLIKTAGFRRFRLMSYWDEHEKNPGTYDFSSLDAQVAAIEKAGGTISLCLGARQPRWPENHWPDWAWELPQIERSLALLNYIKIVVSRYKDRSAIVSYQLENEALLKTFGERPEVQRERLKLEYDLVHTLDPKRPIIMTTSTSWGIPMRDPIPDIVGFSYYQTVYNAQKADYTTAFHSPWLHRNRARLIQLFHKKGVFIHELQLEPWGPNAIWNMSKAEQDKSMSDQQIVKNISLAASVRRFPIDLWGGEWWYWRHTLGDDTIWKTVKAAIKNHS